MRATYLKISLLAAFIAAGSLQAQIPVTSGGSAVQTFTTLPPITSWSTATLPGAGGTFNVDGTGPATMDAAVQARAASSYNFVLSNSTAATPGTSSNAWWSSATTGFVQTRPTGNAGTALLATLTNVSGGILSTQNLSYTLSTNNVAPVSEEIGGHRLYYSLSGAVNEWFVLGTYSNAGPVFVPMDLTATPWPNNTAMYVLFVDDNALAGNDGSYQIDNFSIITTIACPGITAQPQNVSFVQCTATTATFSLTATGTIQGIQWYRNNAPIPGANSATYTLNPAGVGDSGAQFQAIVTNSVCSVTSTVATLTVTADTTPPSLLFSYVSTNLTNLVLYFSETISTNCGACGELYANVILVDTNTGNQVATLAGQTYFSGSRVVAIYTDGTPLDISHGYDLTLSLVEDACVGNVLPDTTYPVGHLVEHVIAFDSEWKYDINNGDRSGTGWEATGFNDSAWPSGISGLGHESDLQATNPPVIGIPGTNGVPIRTHLNYMSNGVPVYFRKHFSLPGASAVQAGLVINDVVEDGAIYYINGQEVFRHNVNPGVLSAGTLAAANQTDPTPIQGPFHVTGAPLVVGDNVIAVVVLQSAAGGSTDIELAVDLSVVVTQPLPVGPTLHISANGSVSTITWTGGGTLQRSLNISSTNNWVTIPGASSPFVTNAPPAIQFFRVTLP